MASGHNNSFGKRLARLEAKALRQRHEPHKYELLKQDPAQLLALAGLKPDAWQQAFLRSQARQMLLLCARQTGKSTVAAALALRVALFEAPALVLLLSPTLRQSGELFVDKVVRLYHALDCPVPSLQQSALSLRLANGSRIISLPGDEANVRGYSSVSLLVVDEASRVRDSLYVAVRPMLAVSLGRIVCLSTPCGKRGWFYDAWSGTDDWQRFTISARECPRIPPEFLAEEERTLGKRWFDQEYLCSFADAIGQVFSSEDIQAAFTDDLPPLYPDGLD